MIERSNNIGLCVAVRRQIMSRQISHIATKVIYHTADAYTVDQYHIISYGNVTERVVAVCLGPPTGQRRPSGP